MSSVANEMSSLVKEYDRRTSPDNQLPQRYEVVLRCIKEAAQHGHSSIGLDLLMDYSRVFNGRKEKICGLLKKDGFILKNDVKTEALVRCGPMKILVTW